METVEATGLEEMTMRTAAFTVGNKIAPVTIYSEKNYLGKSQGLWAGWYNLSSWPLEVPNDQVRSIKVESGWKVELFSDGYVQGQGKGVTADDDDLSGVLENVTTVVVYKDDSTKGGPGPIFNADGFEGDQPALLAAMATNSPNQRMITLGTGLVESVDNLLEGYHVQGMGHYGNYTYLVVSDRKRGDLIVYNPVSQEGEEASKVIQLPSGYAHPCNVQIAGNYLLISIEEEYGTVTTAKSKVGDAVATATDTVDKFESWLRGKNVSSGWWTDSVKETLERQRKSKILIYSLLPDPWSPKKLGEIDQPDANCGGAGIAFHHGVE